MNRKYSVAITISQLTALHHVLIKVYHPVIQHSAPQLLQFLILITALIFALLGLLLLIRSFASQPILLQKIMELLMWSIIIATTGAFGNAIQNGMTGIWGNVTAGIFVGGAISGLIAACGGGATYGLSVRF